MSDPFDNGDHVYFVRPAKGISIAVIGGAFVWLAVLLWFLV